MASGSVTFCELVPALPDLLRDDSPCAESTHLEQSGAAKATNPSALSEDSHAQASHSDVLACPDGLPHQVIGSQKSGDRHYQEHKFDAVAEGALVFFGEWDDDGVFVYQAYNDEIADWALSHQRFGGPKFCPKRMTWIKPSFGWVLYRSGYGAKHGQNRILKIKISHNAIAELLNHCRCLDTNKETRKARGAKDPEVSNGVVQWDPERDLMCADGKDPRQLKHRRAIQIGLKGRLSEFYVNSTISIQEVTTLAHRISQAHRSKKKGAIDDLRMELPVERPYMPCCPDHRLVELGMLPGDQASATLQIGRGAVA